MVLYHFLLFHYQKTLISEKTLCVWHTLEHCPQTVLG